MNTKFFSFILYILEFFFIFIYSYKLKIFLFKMKVNCSFKYQILCLMPKFFNFLVIIYKKNFLLFYFVDVFLSGLFFLYLINNSLDVLFPIAGVVYNETMFEDILV